jgi:hypothetical protein
MKNEKGRGGEKVSFVLSFLEQIVNIYINRERERERESDRKKESVSYI